MLFCSVKCVIIIFSTDRYTQETNCNCVIMINVQRTSKTSPCFPHLCFQTIWYLYTAVYFCQLCSLSHLHSLPWRWLQFYKPRAGEYCKKIWNMACCCLCTPAVCVPLLYCMHVTAGWTVWWYRFEVFEGFVSGSEVRYCPENCIMLNLFIEELIATLVDGHKSTLVSIREWKAGGIKIKNLCKCASLLLLNYLHLSVHWLWLCRCCLLCCTAVFDRYFHTCSVLQAARVTLCHCPGYTQ